MRLDQITAARWTQIDVVVAAGLTAGALKGLTTLNYAAPVALAMACCVACTSAVAWRRRAPALATVVAGAGMVAFVYATHDQSPLFQSIALLLTIYTVGTRGVARRDLVQLGTVLAYGVAVCLAVAYKLGGLTVSSVITNGAPLTLLPAAAGLIVARRRELMRRVAAATRQLRDEQELRVNLVASQERTRLARELHDVVAHGVSVMVIQAGVARITARDEPVTAKAALEEVVTSGRAAMTELRRIVGMLRRDDTTGSLQFGLSGLNFLVDRLRAGGLTTELTIVGEVQRLSDDLDLAVYRIVQEALTNVVKHAASAPAVVQVAFDANSVEVCVTNFGPPDRPVQGRPTSPGHGLIGMRERVDACGGTLRHSPLVGGGYEVRAQLPLAGPDHPPFDRRSTAASAISAAGGWVNTLRRQRRIVLTGIVTALVLVALVADVFISADRRGSVTLNVVLVAAMALLLPWRRRAPLLFLIAVNLLAVPLSNGLTSIDNPTLVSTYVFAVPLWTVAAWAPLGTATAGLALALGACIGEGLYWQLGAGGILGTALLTVAVWVMGRVIGSQRALGEELERTLLLVVAEQEDRERLAVAGEDNRIVGDLDSRVAEQVVAMIVHAEATSQLLGEDPQAAIEAIGRIESTGREALAQMRQILGLLRSAHDPAELRPHLGLEHIHNLVERSRAGGASVELTVRGQPGPLLGGVDLVAYRLVEEMLARTVDEAAGQISITVRFADDVLELDLAAQPPSPHWPSPEIRERIERCEGQIHRSVRGLAEHITVQLPRNLQVAGR